MKPATLAGGSSDRRLVRKLVHPVVRSINKAISNKEAAKTTAKSSIYNVKELIKRLKSHLLDKNSLYLKPKRPEITVSLPLR